MPRPSKTVKEGCCTLVNGNIPLYNFVYIGDTSECVVAAYKLYNNAYENLKNTSSNYKLIVLFEGQDQITCHNKIVNVSFVANNINFIKSFFKARSVNYISRGDNVSSVVPPALNQYNNLAQYEKIPRGPCSDFLTLPTIPEVSLGYIDLYTSKNSVKFLQQNVISVEFNSVEKNVLKNLGNSISAGRSNNTDQLVGALLPKTHLFFANKPDDNNVIVTRNILAKYFYKLLEAASVAPGVVSLYFNVSKLTFKKSTTTCGWNISFITPGIKNTHPQPVKYDDCFVRFKTDPLTYTRLVTKGLRGCNTTNSRSPVLVRIPVQYKSVITAPISIITDASGVVMPTRQDLVTTSFSFTVPESTYNQSTTFAFAAFPSIAGYVYTSYEDLFTGIYSQQTYTCLTSEMVCGQRSARKVFYDIRFKSNVVIFNSNAVEQYTKTNVKNVQKAIYNAYGLTSTQYPDLSSDGYIELKNNSYGTAKDFQWFTFTPRYNTMPATMVRTINGIYIQEDSFQDDENLPCCGSTSPC